MAALNESAAPAAPQRSRYVIRTLVGVAVAALAVFLLLRRIDWRSALDYIRAAQPVWFFASLLMILLTSIAKSQRWRALFPPAEPGPTRMGAFQVLMVGQLLNFILPLRSGDVSRAYFMGRHRGASTAAAAGTIGAEKLIDLLIVGFLFALLLPMLVMPDWLGASRRAAIILSLAAAVVWLGILLMLPTIQQFLARLGDTRPRLARISTLLARVLDGFTALRHRQRLPMLILWSALGWATALATNLLLLHAVALPATLVSALLVLLIVQGGISVPIAPAQIGVFEWLAVLALSLTGAPADQALAFAILLHVAVLIFPIAIGLPWLWRNL